MSLRLFSLQSRRLRALEADVNEIFIDANINLGEHDKELMDEIWNLIEPKAILDKYEMALFLKKKERFDIHKVIQSIRILLP